MNDFWPLLTRLGETGILLPAALLVMLALARRPVTRPLAFRWFVFLCGASLMTAASKVAFMGWGLGSAALNFTGISGHSMVAAAIYPLLLVTLASHAPPVAQRIALATGFALALLVGISRLAVDAHSVSEVIAGLLLGSAASAAVIARTQLPRAVIGPLMPALVAGWLLVMPIQAPPLETHGLMTQLSLTLSGHTTPHTRTELFYTGQTTP